MGAHAAPCLRAPTPALLLVLLITSSCVFGVSAESESEILLKFKKSLGKETAMSNWNYLTSPCTGDKGNWVGVICFNGSVWGLQLENMGLVGIIDVDSLVSLPYLRTLSFMNNAFNGPMPNVKKLGALKSVFLSNNQFYGEISDDAFAGMGSLKKVYLANNRFSGKIPSSLAALPRLLELRLEKNRFEGQIPDFRQESLQEMNVSDNELEGPIPKGLSKMASSSFSGNQNLCGQPLDSCNSSKMQSGLLIALVVMGIGLILAAVGVVFMIHHRSTQKSRLGRKASLKNPNKSASSHGNQVEHDSRKNRSTKRGENGKLSFVRDNRERFDLPDLLQSTAQVLGRSTATFGSSHKTVPSSRSGSETFGSSYKTVLPRGEAMVVKRYKQMNNVGSEEFHEHMRRLGRLRHPNLLPLVAYYYRKEEKLLVSDFVEDGSLASHLHGNDTTELSLPMLHWPTRLNIIKGIVKALAYLYSEIPSLIVPHGNLKSSNVLLDKSFEPLLTDYALMPMINLDHAQRFMVAYKSPEYAQYGRTTKKTDVWSFGVLILEVLTGRKGDVDLASWVSSIPEEEWTSEVFDKEMGRTKDGDGETMMKLLKIGLACCEEDVKIRWDLKEVVEKIEELEKRDSDEKYPSHASEGDFHSSTAGTADSSFSFPLDG